MRNLSILFLLIMSVACSSTKQAEVKPKSHTCDEVEYSRYQATVIGYCQEAAAKLPESVPVTEKELVVKSLDKIPEVFWFNKALKYSLVKQDGEAPLVFVIAGTGASYKSAKMLGLQKSLYQQGYHVISISSPTFSDFIVNTATDTNIPGYLSQDAETLYHVMELALAQVKSENNVKATSFSLTGYSLGGAHSAFISYLDESRKSFNFEKVVLINPPVSLYNSVGVLDSYLDLDKNRAAVRKMFDRVFHQLAQSYGQQETSSFDSDSLYSLFNDAQLDKEELKLLIGTSFRLSSSDMFFAIDQSKNLGFFNYKNHKVSKFESVTDSMYRTHEVTFTRYFEGAVVPWAQEQEPVTREEMIDRLSLHSIESYLRESKKIHMVTNADDIILIDGEVDYLQEVFGDRAKVFERGGHCGNMDRESFVAYLNTQFPGASH